MKHLDEKQEWLFGSTLLNVTLAGAKLGWGWYMGSTLVTADGIHSISDVFGALLIFLALYFAAHKSKMFPYGLHKLEDMAAVIGGFGILLAGYEIVSSVFFEDGIKTPENIWTTVGFIIVLIIIQYVFYYYELKAANRLNSPGVRADAINWLGDIGAGAIVVVGLIAHHFNIPYAQEIAVVIIVFMIFKGAYKVLKEGMFSLLDATDINLSKKISDLILSYPDITQINRIMVRKSGSVYFVGIELSITDISTKKAHDKIDEIVDTLHKNIKSLEAVTIHYEPEHKEFKTTMVLLENDKESLSDTFGTAPWIRIIRENKNSEIISDTIIQNPINVDSKGKAFHLVAWMISNHADVIVMKCSNFDKNIAILFDALGIQIKYE